MYNGSNFRNRSRRKIEIVCDRNMMMRGQGGRDGGRKGWREGREGGRDGGMERGVREEGEMEGGVRKEGEMEGGRVGESCNSSDETLEPPIISPGDRSLWNVSNSRPGELAPWKLTSVTFPYSLRPLPLLSPPSSGARGRMMGQSTLPWDKDMEVSG